MAIFFHWVYTYAGQVVATGVTRSALYNALEYVSYVLVAVLVIIVWEQELKRRASATLPAS
jgi:hypothetical protein